MSAPLQIICDNCGAKYRLPESFAHDTSKCKQCGAKIDVARQRQAAAQPAGATATPVIAAGAKPARARPAEPVRSSSQRNAAPQRPGRRGSEPTAGEGKSRREEKAARTGSKVPLVLAAIGGLAVVLVIIVLVNQGGDGKKQPAGKPGTAAPKEAAGKAGNASAKDAPAKKGDAAKPTDATKQPNK